MSSRLLLLIAALLLCAAGCNMFAPPPANQTLEAQRNSAATLVADARATATPAADRLAVTVEAAQTSVARSAGQSTRIAATLFTLGTPFVDIRFITPLAPTQPALAPGASGSSGSSGPPAVLPTVIGQGSAQGNATLLAPPVTRPPGAEVTAEAETGAGSGSSPALVNAVMTDRVGADDCAVGSLTDFSSTALGIYIAATAVNVPAGSLLTARFLKDGAEQIYYEWSPGFDIAQGCIWFYMPATDVALTAGSWSATLELNGVEAVPALPFTITDAASSG